MVKCLNELQGVLMTWMGVVKSFNEMCIHAAKCFDELEGCGYVYL